jgi:hypothetical protein
MPLTARKVGRWIGGSILLILVLMFIVYPLALGSFGRFESMRFNNGLHVGMTTSEVFALRDETHGSTTGTLPSSNAVADFRSGTPLVWYMEFVTFCYESGSLYHLHFDEEGRLRSWFVEPYADGCWKDGSVLQRLRPTLRR